MIKHLADTEIYNQVKRTLGETGAYLIKQYGLNEEEHQKYITKIIERFKNTYLKDGVTRVGRSPHRKLGPDDRLVCPAIEAKKAGLPFTNLAKAIAAALLFDFKEDEEAMKLQAMINESGVATVLKEVCQLDETDQVTKEILHHYEVLKK